MNKPSIKCIKNILIPSRHDQKPLLVDVAYMPTNTPKKIVVFLHGFKGFKDWGHFNEVMHFFAENNMVFVKFNFSHNGGTIDQPIDFPDLESFGKNTISKELTDVKTVLDWVVSGTEIPNNEKDLKDISIIGHSRGGGVAMLAAAYYKEITKVVTWAAVCSFHDRLPNDLNQWKEDGVIYMENTRTKQQMPMYYSFVEDLLLNKSMLSIECAVKKLRQPQLIIHGTNDATVPLNEAEKLSEWNPTAQLKVIEDGDHTFGIKHPFKKSDKISRAAKQVLDLSLAFIQEKNVI